jgi:hypothetical protein
MKKKRIIVIALLVIVIIGIFIGAIYLLTPYDDQVNRYPKIGLSDFDNIGRYRINPETILASLDRGETNVFMPESATPESPVLETAVSWRQSDYLEIADALHQFVWKETLDSWNLYNIELDAVCQDNPNGFGVGDLVFFKSARDNGETKYSTRELLITPQYGDVSWGGGANFPYPIFGWKSINLSLFKVTAEDALKIAEENGGRIARLSVQNECRIVVSMNSNAYTGWRVIYFPNSGGLRIFEKQIDPYTGRVIR